MCFSRRLIFLWLYVANKTTLGLVNFLVATIFMRFFFTLFLSILNFDLFFLFISQRKIVYLFLHILIIITYSSAHISRYLIKPQCIHLLYGTKGDYSRKSWVEIIFQVCRSAHTSVYLFIPYAEIGRALRVSGARQAATLMW